MTERPLKNIAASVHQRLLDRARESGRPFNQLLQYFAMERFLYRLSESSHAERFVLKGALMLTAWGAPLSRPTLDIDLLGEFSNEVEAVAEVVRDICAQEVKADGVEFDADSVTAERIAEEAEYEGVRVRFRGNLGNARLAMRVDVGFGDVVVPAPEPIEYPAILDLPAPRLRGYTRESAIAEKLETMERLGLLNSRMRDLYDIWLLSREFNFEGPALRAAIEATCRARGAKPPRTPVALTSVFAEDEGKQTQWRAFRLRGNLDDAPEELPEMVAAIAEFLLPLLQAMEGARMTRMVWRAPGPWREI